MTSRMLLARMHLHVEHQPQMADHQGVVGVARSAWFVGVVAKLGPVLMTEERLDRHIQIQHPGVAQGRQPGLGQSLDLPACAGLRIGSGKGPSHAVLAAHLAHPRPDRIDRVGAQTGDVCVAELTGQDRKGDRAQKVGQGGSVRTGETQWTSLNPLTEKARSRQELAEEDQLTQWRERRGRIPLHVDAPAMGVHRQPIQIPLFHLTKRVNLQSPLKRVHPQSHQPFSSTSINFNCRI